MTQPLNVRPFCYKDVWTVKLSCTSHHQCYTSAQDLNPRPCVDNDHLSVLVHKMMALEPGENRKSFSHADSETDSLSQSHHVSIAWSVSLTIMGNMVLFQSRCSTPDPSRTTNVFADIFNTIFIVNNVLADIFNTIFIVIISKHVKSNLYHSWHTTGSFTNSGCSCTLLDPGLYDNTWSLWTFTCASYGKSYAYRREWLWVRRSSNRLYVPWSQNDDCTIIFGVYFSCTFIERLVLWPENYRRNLISSDFFTLRV